MIRQTDLAHKFIAATARAGDSVVDATVGNGHDTLFLAGLVGPTGRVIGFDIQEAALKSAGGRVGHLPQVRLLNAGHECLGERVREILSGDGAGKSTVDTRRPLSAAMFNLGYLPGSSKILTTRAETTISAIEQALTLLKAGGVITVVAYRGHPGGADEAAAVSRLAENLGPEFAVTAPDPAQSIADSPVLLVFRRLTDGKA